MGLNSILPYGAAGPPPPRGALCRFFCGTFRRCHKCVVAHSGKSAARKNIIATQTATARHNCAAKRELRSLCVNGKVSLTAVCRDALVEPPEDKLYKTCSVVGNSGVLRESNCADHIDSADYVFRCNMPPLTDKRHLSHVGTKSNFTTAPMSMLRKTTSHHRDNRMHRRDNKMRRRDNKMRRGDNRMHRRDNKMHRRDNRMHRRDNKMHRRDNKMHRRDNKMHRRNSGPLGRSKRGTSSSGPAAGAGARAAPGGAGAHVKGEAPCNVLQSELKKQFGAMKQGRSTDIREELVRYAGRPVEAFDPQGPGPRGGAGSPGKQREPSRERPSQTAG
ncbi:hypothetical protein Bbelb_270500 [Branchiostoma belcheri]|nr:hypothetical protein Bbelb_270500 [Branchiostoma belcheri]